jgi:hypothetical protein
MPGCFVSYTPALPAGWTTVTYQGIGIDVPASWAVEPFPNCASNMPTVILGTEGSDRVCNQPDGVAFVQIQPGEPSISVSHPHAETINGLDAVVESVKLHVQCGPANEPESFMYIKLPGNDLFIVIAVGQSPACPGGAPGRAQEIANSIHGVS